MQPTAAPKAVFNEAIALINAGELGAAEARCRAALERYPRDVNMQALLGALLVKMDRRARRRQRCARSSRRRRPSRSRTRTSATCWCSRAAPAEPCRSSSARRGSIPKLERAWFSLGKALALLGRGKEADAAFEKMLRAVARARD